MNGVTVAGSNVSATAGVFETTATAYGGYYTWTNAASACPTGWRLPTATEWCTIFGQTFVAGTNGSNISGTLTSYGWAYSGTSGTSSYGLKHTATGLFLPAAGNNGGTSAGSDGRYWSSTEYSGVTSGAHRLYFGSSNVSPQNFNYKTNQISVRCVQ